MEAVKNYGYVSEFVSDSHQGSGEVAMEAVERNWRAVEFPPDFPEDIKDVDMETVKNKDTANAVSAVAQMIGNLHNKQVMKKLP